ncbi:MAG: methyltransferase domain-containing protein [Verrucomicrobia bacterium]|nr:methyltransferase domain-containing protein [Verrucomicrobiota bacterium]
MSKEDDRSLRFYNEVLGLDHLHYGMWEEDEELTLANLKIAQLRYEDFLIEKLPTETSKVLDVGCGTSAMIKRMLSMEMEVHGLSPDATQKDNFTKNLNAPFYHCRFEELESEETFDCLVMSESAQYIPFDRLFENAKRSLKPGGHLMICDYFVLDDATGVLAKSGHKLSAFMAESEKQGFMLVEKCDVTDSISKTLDLASLLANRILKGLDILSERTRNKHPLFTRFVFRLFRKKWKKLERDSVLLDSEQFKAKKRYLFLLFKVS